MRYSRLVCLIGISYLFVSPVSVRAQTNGDDIAPRFGLPPGIQPEFVAVATSPDAHYSEEQAKVNAPDILSVEACHVGGQRLLFRTTFARPPVFANATFILYLDLDNNPNTGRRDKYHNGVDVMVALHGTEVSLSFHNPAFSAGNTFANVALTGNVLYIALDAPLQPADGGVSIGVHTLSQAPEGRGDATPHRVVRLPWHGDVSVPPRSQVQADGLRPLSDYRYHNDKVKYEKLADKGLTYEQVAPAHPITFGRPRPAPTFSLAGRSPQRPAAVQRERIAVNLLEEAGVGRSSTPVSFGFPLPQGEVFDPANIRLTTADGAEIPSQVVVTAFWPDSSLKWVLIDFTTALAAKEQRGVFVEFGSAVRRGEIAKPIVVTDTPDVLTIVTGPLKAEIDKRHFDILHTVWRDADGDGKFADDERISAFGGDGIRLVDETGKLFTTAAALLEKVAVEVRGPLRTVIRIEGRYASADGATYMRYIARLTFRAGSPVVELALTHIDDYLKTEFTDITSLRIPLVQPNAVRSAAVFLRNGNGEFTAEEGNTLRLLQSDEQSSSLQTGERRRDAGQAPGIFRCATARGGIAVAVHDFWQRWPKGFTADGSGASVDLLPVQPGPDYGANLPYYLMYPFVSGKYRFKWGMSFTERMSFDFGSETPQELWADANAPLVPVIPAEWYAKTGALGLLAPPAGKQFAEWDKFVAQSYAAHMRAQTQNREYGHFNYGDWWGERGRNWGNNEYDLPHGMFMQFARTGNRDYYRLALLGARHQADVDCVHAYPDPFYVGANHQHSIGHTGTWSQEPTYATWSHRYDEHTDARNGHTWADGMMDAWYMAGDAPVMESALALGEHITWAMSRDFHALGTHERSAGWSLKAIMAIYRGTYDPLYMEAAKRIADVALREQKFDRGGAWPHVLPEDYNGGHPGAVGNNLFLIGILLGGLEAYHEETHDPAVLRSLQSGAKWVATAWNENAEGWPYSAAPDGKPYYKPSVSLNALIIEPLAYVGSLTGDDRLIHIAESALGSLVRQGPDAFGKSLAQQMHYTSGTLALLQRWYDQHKTDKGLTVLDGTGAGLENYLRKVPDADEYSVRAPDTKVFYIRLRGESGELTALRSPYGAMEKRAEFGTLRITDAADREVAADKFSTDGEHEYRCPLHGANSVFKVVINDDQRGVWTLRGKGLQIVMATVPGFRIGGVDRSRYHFFVPPGTKEFRVHLLGVHTGAYGGAAVAPDGRIVAMHQSSNEGGALIPGAPQAAAATNQHPEKGDLVVRPAPGDTGKMWSLILWAAGDIGCELDGVPPLLSLTEDAWFAPRKP